MCDRILNRERHLKLNQRLHDINGWIPEWPKGADCKSVGTAFEGSNPSPSIVFKQLNTHAGVAELADAQDLKSCRSNTVPVRFRSPAVIF